ncbi:MAG: OmpH family outer membrane protein [Alphaproteobacteria bacterium]|nr:OmpH family outer membrane protein [Alphaproteobacteria bacterium]
MKKLLTLALFSAALSPALAAAPPAPKVVVLDRIAILQNSKVGRDIARQLQALTVQNRNSFEAQQKALTAEQQQLTQKVAIMAADQRQKTEDAFRAKVQNMQESAQRRAAQIQQVSQSSSQIISQALAPIVDEIVKERGANLVIDKQAVIFANSNAFEITQEAISKLDAKMPSYKVTLGAAPAALPQ